MFKRKSIVPNLAQIRHKRFFLTKQLTHYNQLLSTNLSKLVKKKYLRIYSIPEKKPQPITLARNKWITLFKEVIAVYTENRMKGIKYALCAEFGSVHC
jgi:hypothetical protein